MKGNDNNQKQISENVPWVKTAYPTTQTHFPSVFIPAPLQQQ